MSVFFPPRIVRDDYYGFLFFDGQLEQDFKNLPPRLRQLRLFQRGFCALVQRKWGMGSCKQLFYAWWVSLATPSPCYPRKKKNDSAQIEFCRRIIIRGSVRQASAKRTLRKAPPLLTYWKVRHAYAGDGREDRALDRHKRQSARCIVSQILHAHPRSPPPDLPKNWGPLSSPRRLFASKLCFADSPSKHTC